MQQLHTQADFEQLALAAFPELSEDFADAGGRITMQMASFARHLQQQKSAAHWDSYAKGVRVASTLWQRPDKDLHGALSLTLMKGLDFDGPNGPRAWEKLPPELQHAWTATRRHLDELSALPKKQRGPRS
jgi:hypothetical protein